MTADAWDVALNIIASVITGSAVWVVSRTLARRRLRRKQDFFGLRTGGECLLVVPRHATSDREKSVHRNDAAALLELSSILGDLGARPEVIFHDQGYQGMTDKTEFCIGGPESNRRTAAHLRSMLPGLRVATLHGGSDKVAITAGDQSFVAEQGRVEFAVLAKLVRDKQDKPTFLICGQLSLANRAAGRYLANNYRTLMRTHGVHGQFCLILRVIESATYGPGVVELVRDATRDAFASAGAAADADA